MVTLIPLVVSNAKVSASRCCTHHVLLLWYGRNTSYLGEPLIPKIEEVIGIAVVGIARTPVDAVPSTKLYVLISALSDKSEFIVKIFKIIYFLLTLFW
jgi:hypothetical protein